MQTEHYKSDLAIVLTLRDAQGQALAALPTYDWEVAVTSGRPRPYAHEWRCWHRDGQYHNCAPDGANTVRLILNNHGLQPGELWATITLHVPDASMPDGERRVVSEQSLGVTLDRSGRLMVDGTEVTANAVVTVPLSLVIGHEAVLADISAGKGEIARAIRRHGVDCAESASLTDMAERVLQIPVKVEGDPTAITPAAYGCDRIDLLNYMHSHRRADYPYMTGALFHTPTITLTGAAAYIVDGELVTESGEMQLEPGVFDHVVIWLYDYADYTAPMPPNTTTHYLILNGRPSLPTYGVYVERWECYAEETAPLMGNLFPSGAYCGRTAYVGGLRENGKTIMDNNGSLYSLSLPSLQSVSGGYVANGCSALTALSLPSLQSVSGGYVAAYCSALTALSLPSLVEINSSSNFLYYNDNIRLIDCPRLRRANLQMGFNACRPPIGGVVINLLSLVHAPSLSLSLGAMQEGRFVDVRMGSQTFEIATDTIRFYHHNEASFLTHIHIERGFRVNLNLSSLTGVPTDSIKHIAANLGDCTELGVSLTWTLNATQKAMLTDEEKASVTARGWNIA